MIQPAAQQGLDRPLQEADEGRRLGVGMVLAAPGAANAGPKIVSERTIPRQPMANIWSNSVIAQGPTAWLLFHFLDRFQEPDRFLRAFPAGADRPAGGAAPAASSRGHDLLRIAPLAQGHVQQGLFGQLGDARPRQAARIPSASPRNTARSTCWADYSQPGNSGSAWGCSIAAQQRPPRRRPFPRRWQ